MLAIVNYPTLEELRANQDKPGIREYVEGIDAGLDRFAREKLREPDQLPEIDSLAIEIEPDFDARELDNPRTLLLHRGDVIFSDLRHSNVSITLGYYLKTASPEVLAGMNKLEDAAQMVEKSAAPALRDSYGTVKPSSDASPELVN